MGFKCRECLDPSGRVSSVLEAGGGRVGDGILSGSLSERFKRLDIALMERF